MIPQIGEEAVKAGLEETNHIADMIDEVNMPFQKPFLPTYPLPDGYTDNFEYLKHLCEKGWKKRGLDKLSPNSQKEHRDRLDYELGIIHNMGFDGYFLIVWDYIAYCKSHNQAIGDGRGSGGGALVDYLLNISQLDPLPNNLIFERFLNPERISMPKPIGHSM
jgi:DNA polymerase-3 subunit alpha